MPIAAIIGLVIQLAPIVAQAIPQVAASVRDLVDQIVGNAPAADQAKLAADWAAVRDHVAKADADWAAGWQQPVIERLFPVAGRRGDSSMLAYALVSALAGPVPAENKELVQMVVVALSQGSRAKDATIATVVPAPPAVPAPPVQPPPQPP